MQSNLYEAIGKEFSSILLKDLGMDVMREVVAKNSTDEYVGCCASHDFQDANMSMLEAFNKVCGREYNFGESDTDIANKAWNYARENGFFIS